MPVRLLEPTASAHGSPLLVKALLRAPLAIAPGQEISYRGERRQDYRELERRVARLAGALGALGVEAGDTVAVMDWDSHRYLECFFAVPMMGAVLQTVNVRLGPAQLLHTLNDAGAELLLVHADFLPLLAAIAPRLERLRAFVLLSEGGAPVEDSPVALAGEYEALLAAAPERHDFPDFDENAQATTFYTSATTGLPKGVRFSHRQLVLHTLAVATALGTAAGARALHREDVYMPLTPLFHVHAWGLPYVATLLGLKQVYPGPYQPATLLRLIEEEGVTLSHCVPTILHMLLNHPEAAGRDLSRWKVVIGGSALPEALALAAQRRGIDILGGYGLSETCPVLTVSQLSSEARAASPEAQSRLRAKAGLPIPLVDLRLVDGDLREVAHDDAALGEVVVRAPWLTPGYTHAPEASEALWAGGWLHTGDIGRIDPAGYLKVTDRMKDVIKVGGEWVSALALEDVLCAHPAVEEVAVIALPDEKWGERPLALVVAKPSAGEVSEQSLRQHAIQAIEQGAAARYGVLLKVSLVERLPKTGVGKLDKQAMRAQALAGAGREHG